MSLFQLTSESNVEIVNAMETICDWFNRLNDNRETTLKRIVFWSIYIQGLQHTLNTSTETSFC